MLKQPLLLFFLVSCSYAFSHSEGGESTTHLFEENKGQWHENVKFKAEIDGASIFFENNAFHYQFINLPSNHGEASNTTGVHGNLENKSHNIKALFVGSNLNVIQIPKNPSTAYYNYFLGNDEDKWASDVRKYQEIKYQNLYEGIDLNIYSHNGSIKYDYLIKTGISPDKIKVKYDGVQQPVIKNGQLIVNHSLGDLIEEKPYAYQIIDNKKVKVICNYKIDEEGLIGFDFPEGFNKEYKLIIDPELIFATYSGSTTSNFGASATYDRLGNGYMGGTIFTNGYNRTTGAFQSSYGGGATDIVVSKFSADGKSLIYSSYLGGAGCESINSMIVDDNLNLIIYGVSAANNYPVSSNAFDKTKENKKVSLINISRMLQNFGNQGTDIVITKLNSTGTDIIGSTYFGGSDIDGLNVDTSNSSSFNSGLVYNYGDQLRGEVIIDSSNNIYVGSSTYSSGINTVGSSAYGGQDGIVVKFNSDLSKLLWSRYIGGKEDDAVYSLKISEKNDLIIGGGTISDTLYPFIQKAYRNSYQGGRSDGFISKLSDDGVKMLHQTFIGTNNYDQVYFVEKDRFGGVYALGQSDRGDFPVINAKEYDTLAGQFFIKLNDSLTKVEFSTTFGDTNGLRRINISPTAFLVDRCQNLYASGWGGSLTGSASEGPKTLNVSMSITDDALQKTTANPDFYLYALSRNADSLLFASFYGGSLSDDHVDGGTSRFDKEGIIYQSICGSCGAIDDDLLVSPNAYSRTDKSLTIIDATGQPQPVRGSCNNFLLKFDFDILPKAVITATRRIGCVPFTTTIFSGSVQATDATEIIWDFYGTTIKNLSSDTTITFEQADTFIVRQIAKDSICDFSDTAFLFFIAYPNDVVLEVSNDTVVCDLNPITIEAKTDGTANQFVWSSSRSFSDTLNNLTDSFLIFQPLPDTTVYYIKASKTAIDPCEKVDSVIIISTPLLVEASALIDTVCEQSSVDLTSNLNNVDQFKWIFDDLSQEVVDSNPSRIFNSPGDYTITLLGTNFVCNRTDTSVININVAENTLFLEKLPDTFSCLNAEIEFIQNSYGTASTFLWSTSPTFVDTLNNYPSDSSIFLSFSPSTSFFIKISDTYCEELDTIEYENIIYDLNFLDLVDTSCTPYNERLGTTIIGLDSFRINLGNGLSTTTDSTPQIMFNQEGRYTIELIGSNQLCNFADTLEQTVQVYQSVSLNSIMDTTICRGDTIVLTGNSSGTAKQFFWDINNLFGNPLNSARDSSLQIFPNETTTYFLKGQNAVCDDIEPVTITAEVVDIVANDKSICLDDTLLLEAIIIEASTSLNYIWSPNDSIISGQTTNSILTSPKENILFEVVAISRAGCEDFDIIEVEVNPPAFTKAEILSFRDSLYRGEETTLSTDRLENNLSYLWEPIEDFLDPYLESPVLTANESKIYKVIIEDLNTGCIVEAFKRIIVFEVNCGEPNIFIPTAFTPNYDLRNDILYIRGPNIERLEFQLFNRWGQLVFETSDKNMGWDGTYKGKEIEPGIFAYQLKATCFDGQEFFKKGNITLIR